jgi:uncharacterized protein (DUF885 family)
VSDVPHQHQQLAALADEFWELTMRSNPTDATLLGDHRYDDQIEDLSAEGEAAQRSAHVELRDRLQAIDTSALGLVDQVTAALLMTSLDDRILVADLGIAELASDQMDGPHMTFLVCAPQLAAAEPEHANMLVGRLGRLGGALDDALDRFRDGLARGRTPAQLCVARSINSIDGYLASPVSTDPFINMEGPTGWSGEAAWRDALTEVVRSSVRPAYLRFRDALEFELLPRGRPDDKAGLCWIDDGEELYTALVRLHTSIDITADEIHAIGVEHVEVALPAEYGTLGARAFGTDDIAEIFDRIRHDPDLKFPSADAIVERAEATVARGVAAMDSWFGRLPMAPCRVEPVPEFMEKDLPGAYYFPPAEDGSRPGTYFINRRNATEQSRVEAESVAFHEAIPGHHLQLAIASELVGLPAFRRHLTGSTSYIEGWGLYAERLADEMGLYSGDVDRLGMLAADSWRAGRLVVDTGLHAKGWSRERARDYLGTNAPVGVDELEAEVDRYVAIPGQAVSYKIGQREIVALRADAESRLGSRFDIRGFHDAVLGSGGVTLPVLRQIVHAWVEQVRHDAGGDSPPNAR